jgi:putative transcriptional regulator
MRVAAEDLSMKTRIRELREERGLTQEAMAQIVDVTRQTILFLEKGKYNPSLRLAHQIAQVFNLRIEDVFFFEDEEKQGKSEG